MIRPPALRPGDAVALVAPAGPVDESKVQTALERCRALELEPVPGHSIRSRAGYLAGSDSERAADLSAALAADVAAIWALRGGYGSLRALQHVDLTPLRERPRPFIGFSDNTAVHLALLRLGLVSFHGPHAGFEHFPAATQEVFRRVLFRPEAAGPLTEPSDSGPVTVRGGVAEGPLVGGNLALLAASCGTIHQPDTRGAILFLEDVAEPLYRVDRMLLQLRMAGLLDDVAGIALGDFVAMPDPLYRAASDGEPCLETLVAELLEPLGVPIALGLPFGHGRENWTLPLGVRARLDAGEGSLSLLEPAVA